MGRATLYSALLHLGVVVFLVVGMPSLLKDLESPPPIPVQIVDVSELDAAPPKPSKKPPPPKPDPKPVVKEEPKPEPIPEPQQAKLPEPAPEPEPLPEPEPEEVVLPEPEKKPEPAPEPEPEVAEETAPPKPKSKPKIKSQVAEKPKKKKEEPKEDRLTTILRNVDKLKKQPSATPQTAEVEETEATPQPRTSRIEQATLARLIANQMSRCWRIDPGAQAAENLVVVIEVSLDRTGEVIRVDFAEQGRVASDAFYRSAAENARRAILECAPFELPVKRYEVWKQMTLRFDPAQMFGG